MKQITNHNSDTNNQSSSNSRQHHSSHSSHRHKRRGFWYHFSKIFRRRKDRISGVRKNQQIEETRLMVIFTLIAIGLLCILIPLVTGFFEYF